MLGINKGTRRRKLAVNKDKVNFIQNDANIINSFSHFLIGYFKKSIKSHWLKS